MWKWLCAMFLGLTITLNAGDCCITPSLYVGGEGLWWTVCQEDLEFAVDVDSEGGEMLVGPGETHALEYDWRGGARGFIGFDGYCGWDIRAVYTWYKNNTDENLTQLENLLIASWAHPGGIGFNALTATASQNFKYETADLIFGKELTFTPLAFTLAPFVGVRCLKINQDISALYEGEDFSDNPQLVTFKSDLKAIGIYTGLHMRNNLCCGLGFYGDFAGSMLYGQGKSKQHQLSLDSTGAILNTVVNLEEDPSRILPGCHLRAGMDWLFEVGCMNFHIQAGYEFNHWFNTPIISRFYDNVNHGISSTSKKGEITLHGATLSAALRF
jgi:hypothetical protein